MPDNVIITSTRNPRVVNARKLLQRKHRERQGRFLVEGGQLLWMALDGGFIIDEVYTSGPLERKDSTSVLLAKLTQHGATLIQVAPSILASLSTRRPRGGCRGPAPDRRRASSCPITTRSYCACKSPGVSPGPPAGLRERGHVDPHS